MGVVWKSVMFLLRRAPEIYATGRLINQSFAAAPALTGGESISGGEGGRVEAIERELRLLNEERERLAGEVERLSRGIAALEAEAGRSRRTVRLLMLLFTAVAASVLFVGAVILSRFP
jgi:hypothetical protein